jgi:hypothetical protein
MYCTVAVSQEVREIFLAREGERVVVFFHQFSFSHIPIQPACKGI